MNSGFFASCTSLHSAKLFIFKKNNSITIREDWDACNISILHGATIVRARMSALHTPMCKLDAMNFMYVRGSVFRSIRNSSDFSQYQWISESDATKVPPVVSGSLETTQIKMLVLKMIQFVVLFVCMFHHGLTASIDHLDDITVKTQVVDLQNPEEVNTIYRRFNLSADTLVNASRQFPRIKTNVAFEPSSNFSDVKTLRVLEIQDKIGKAMASSGNFSSDLPSYEMAAFPICTQVNYTMWKNETNVTIKFSPSLFENERPNMYLHTAVLRLHKLSPVPESHTSSVSSCSAEPLLSQVRVTIYTLQHAKRNKRERRKRICNTLMLNTTSTGWVGIDVKKAIYIWEKAEQQASYGRGNYNVNNRWQVITGWLVIDVHDEDERQLNAGSFFAPPKCEEFQQYQQKSENRLTLKLIWKKCHDKKD